MDEKQLLLDYVATANNPKYQGDMDAVLSKFPELEGIDNQILLDYIATANNPEYAGDMEAVNSKFPDLFEQLSQSTGGETVTKKDAPGQELFDTLFEVAPTTPLESSALPPEQAQQYDWGDEPVTTQLLVPGEEPEVSTEEIGQYAEKVRNSRTSTRKNADGSESTVLMTQSDNYAYPTLFQEADGTWTELEADAAFERAKKQDEVYVFKTEGEAMRFAEGAWKD